MTSYILCRCKDCGHIDQGFGFYSDIRQEIIWYCPNERCKTNTKGIEYDSDRVEDLKCTVCNGQLYFRDHMEQELRCAKCGREYVRWRRTKTLMVAGTTKIAVTLLIAYTAGIWTVAGIIGMVTGGIAGCIHQRRKKKMQFYLKKVL